MTASNSFRKYVASLQGNSATIQLTEVINVLLADPAVSSHRWIKLGKYRIILATYNTWDKALKTVILRLQRCSNGRYKVFDPSQLSHGRNGDVAALIKQLVNAKVETKHLHLLFNVWPSTICRHLQHLQVQQQLEAARKAARKAKSD